MLLNKNALRRAAVALALPPLLAACTAAPSPGPSASSTPTPSPTMTSTTLSPAEQDLANAEQAVVKLWAVVDRLTNDPQASLQELDTVTSGKVRTFFQENVMSYRAQGWIGSGTTSVEPEAVELAGTNAQGLTTWTVTACIDASGTTLVDSSGKSMQTPPYRIRHRSAVIQRSGLLLVAEDEVLGTC